MKKTYKEPEMLNVTLQLQSSLLTESRLTNKDIGGNADFVNGGASSGDTEARVKEYNIWEHGWSE